MRSYQVVEWGAPLEARDYPNPEPAGTEVLIKTSACGVCHSDIHIWHGGFDLGGGRRFELAKYGATLPLTMGHEIVGEVVAMGPDASGAAIGDQRVVYPWIGCRRCDVCARGDEHLCPRPAALGAGYVDGGYSDHVLVPDAKYLVDYGEVPTDLACTYACSGLTAYGALAQLPELTADDSVVIIGLGGVGLSAVHIAPALTKAKIIAADIAPDKRDAAKAAGAHEVVDNGDKQAVREVKALTGGGAAATIDFVGRPETTQFGMTVLGKGGLHVIVGLYGDSLPISLAMIPLKDITIKGSTVGSLAQLHDLMGLVKAGRVPPIPVAPRPLAEADQAIRDLNDGKVVGRVVLKQDLGV